MLIAVGPFCILYVERGNLCKAASKLYPSLLTKLQPVATQCLGMIQTWLYRGNMSIIFNTTKTANISDQIHSVSVNAHVHSHLVWHFMICWMNDNLLQSTLVTKPSELGKNYLYQSAFLSLIFRLRSAHFSWPN